MAERSLDAARSAAARNDISASRAAHITVVDNAATEEHKKGGERMKTVIFGGLDGIITTFAVVAGAGGGGLSVSTVLIMGFSSLVADALSMGVGDTLSSKAEMEVAARERKREMWELENYPEGEVKEMVEVYMARGLSRDDAESVIGTMAKYPEFFVDQMMRDELGMEPPEGGNDHIWSGLYCFTAFLVCGVVPLIGFVACMPFTDDEATLFGASCGLTACMLFALGAAKARFTTRTWWASGAEILIMGACTAACAYVIGWAVEGLLAATLEAEAAAPGCNSSTVLV